MKDLHGELLNLRVELTALTNDDNVDIAHGACLKKVDQILEKHEQVANEVNKAFLGHDGMFTSYEATLTSHEAALTAQKDEIKDIEQKLKTQSEAAEKKIQQLTEVFNNVNAEMKKDMNKHNENIVNAVGKLNGFGGAGGGGAPAQDFNKSKKISEFKCIQNLKVFDNDREQFVQWNDKLLNAFSEAREGSRPLLSI